MDHAAAVNSIRALAIRARGRADATTVRFFITGGGVALLFFVLSVAAVRAGLSPFLGTLSAYLVCFAVAYLTQRAWTFGGAHRHGEVLPRYIAAQIGCGLLSALLARLLAQSGVLPPLPMAGLVTIASSGASYALSRYWVFADEGRGRAKRT